MLDYFIEFLHSLSVFCSYSQLKDFLCLGSHWVTHQNSGCQTLKPTHPLLLLSIFGGFSTSNKETFTIPGIMIINSHQCRHSLYFSLLLIAIQHCLLFICFLPDFLRLSLPLSILDPFFLPFLFVSSPPPNAGWGVWFKGIRLGLGDEVLCESESTASYLFHSSTSLRTLFSVWYNRHQLSGRRHCPYSGILWLVLQPILGSTKCFQHVRM